MVQGANGGGANEGARQETAVDGRGYPDQVEVINFSMESCVKLHRGCGPCFIPGFTHVDVVPFEHVDIVSSVDNLGMVADGSAELVYAERAAVGQD